MVVDAGAPDAGQTVFGASDHRPNRRLCLVPNRTAHEEDDDVQIVRLQMKMRYTCFYLLGVWGIVYKVKFLA